MKLSFSGLLTACLVLAVAGAVAKVLALLIVLALLSAVITRPREMMALVAMLGMLNLVAQYPFAAVGILGSLTAGNALIRWQSHVRKGASDDIGRPRITDESQRG